MTNVEFQVIFVPSSARPLTFDAEKCVGCNACVEACQVDILIPNPEAGKPPLVPWPGECYYCGSCAMMCPRPGAIALRHPLMNRAKFVPVLAEGAHDEEMS